MNYKLKINNPFKKKFFFSVLALEQAYPEVSGMKLETITQKAQPLPQVIKYFTTWAIVVALAMVLGSLIYAGIMYLSSAGKVDKAKTAREKVKQGFLGLAILAVAYLALQFINPQLTIMQIERKEVSSGVVLLTKAGYDDLKNPDSSLSVMDLVDEGTAFILTTDSFDLKEQLGPLAVEEWAPGADLDSGNASVKKVNFANIPLYGFLFWGKLAQEARVFAYPLPNQQIIEGSPSDPLKKELEGYTPFVYDKKGRVKDNISTGAEPLSKAGFEMSFIPIDFFDLKELTAFYPITIENYQSLAQETKDSLKPQTEMSPRLRFHLQLKHTSPEFIYTL
ncbi:hypothetical protein L6252_01560 [Candidatus Parcubacteria bacterium]|nr:hypothetical protein [Candidatus Parcubacteria bacterium]